MRSNPKVLVYEWELLLDGYPWLGLATKLREAVPVSPPS